MDIKFVTPAQNRTQVDSDPCGTICPDAEGALIGDPPSVWIIPHNQQRAL